MICLNMPSLTYTQILCYPTHMDLFSITYDDPESDDQLSLRDAMINQWRADQDAVRVRGVIPDWIGEPRPLSKDKARLLELLYDVGCIKWGNHPCQNNIDVTRAMGLNNTANARAVIDQCHSEGLVSSRIYRGSLVFEMAQEGEYALEEYQIDKEMGIL